MGMAIYFPMLFVGGVWIIHDVMPDGLRRISDLTPVGAAVQAMDDAWFAGTVSATHLIVMVVYTVVVGLLAIRVFRWE